MMTQDQLEKERYEARLKAQRDMSTSLTVARQEGMLIGAIHICQRQLGQAITPADDLAALPLEELEQLAQRLEAELRSR